MPAFKIKLPEDSFIVKGLFYENSSEYIDVDQDQNQIPAPFQKKFRKTILNFSSIIYNSRISFSFITDQKELEQLMKGDPLNLYRIVKEIDTSEIILNNFNFLYSNKSLKEKTKEHFLNSIRVDFFTRNLLFYVIYCFYANDIQLGIPTTMKTNLKKLEKQFDFLSLSLYEQNFEEIEDSFFREIISKVFDYGTENQHYNVLSFLSNLSVIPRVVIPDENAPELFQRVKVAFNTLKYTNRLSLFDLILPDDQNDSEQKISFVIVSDFVYNDFIKDFFFPKYQTDYQFLLSIYLLVQKGKFCIIDQNVATWLINQ